MKNIFFLIIIVVFSKGYSQEKYNFISDSIINVTPFWKKGMEVNFHYTKNKYLISNRKIRTKSKLDSISYYLNFKVVNSSEDSYKIKWTPYKYRESSKIKKTSFKGIPLIYLTDGYGEIESFENIDYVKKYWKKNIDNFFKKEDVPDSVKKIYSSDLMLESYFLPPLEIFHKIIGYRLNRNGEKYTDSEIIDLGVIKDTLRTVEHYYFTNINEKDLSFTYHHITDYDNENAIKFFKNLSNNVLPNQKTKDFYSNKKASVKNITTIYFDLKNCIPKKIVFKKDVNLIENGKNVLNYIEEQTLEVVM